MPWCPKCKVKYRDGYAICNDCQIELVDKLEFEINKENLEIDDEEKFLVNVSDEMEFNILEAKLKQYGIPVMKKYKESGGFLNIYMGASPFGIDVYVPAKKLSIAKVATDIYENEALAGDQDSLFYS